MADQGSGVKECWYSILGVERTASSDEIRIAYRKEALKWHPDKIQQSGASVEECQKATLRFQSIAQAYEVLGDPTERAWYDKHRNEILSSGSGSKDFEISVWSYFSSSIFSAFNWQRKDFYEVYEDAFKKIHKKEQQFAKAHGMGPIGESPSLGGPDTDYTEVDAFYKFWQGFATIKDYAWCDQYRTSEARNRKERRLMEEENGSIRRHERREFNNSVRELARFVKKRDKRVQDKRIELQRVQMEKEQQLKLHRQQQQEEKLAKARAFKDQEWAKISEEEMNEHLEMNEDEGSYSWKSSKGKGSNTGEADCDSPDEFYCIVCSKRFRSEKQWNNHEKSKKHIERASALKQSFLEEDEKADALVRDLDGEEAEVDVDFGVSGDRLAESQDEVRLSDSDTDMPQKSLDEIKEVTPTKQAEVPNSEEEDEADCDEEDSFLAAMMKLQKLRQLESLESESSVLVRDDTSVVTQEGKEKRSASGSSEDSDGAVEDHDEGKLAAWTRNRRDSSSELNGSTLPSEAEEIRTVRVLECEGACTPGVVEGPVLSEQSDLPSRTVGQGYAADVRQNEAISMKEGNNRVKRNEFLSESGDGAEAMVPKDLGKVKNRRRAKQERERLAASERHEDVLRAYSFPAKNDVRLDFDQRGKTTSAEGSQENKTKSSQKQKQVNLNSASSLASVESRQNAEPVRSEASKKGVKSRGKKTKFPRAPVSNTCDTCGEDFESRNLLFRHISATSHASVKSK